MWKGCIGKCLKKNRLGSEEVRLGMEEAKQGLAIKACSTRGTKLDPFYRGSSGDCIIFTQSCAYQCLRSRNIYIPHPSLQLMASLEAEVGL